jgi:hypothetical protein
METEPRQSAGNNKRVMVLNRLYGIIISLPVVLASACTQQGGEVWVASPWQQVLRSTPPAGITSARLEAAANEFEPFRIIVHNSGDRKLNDLDVTASDLKSGDNVIPAENIRFFRAHYLHVTKPSRRTENPPGRYPDALIPFDDANLDISTADPDLIAVPFSIDTGRNSEVWCDLHVPPGTEPGIYRGAVTVHSGNKKLAKIQVDLTVWDFELPKKIAMRSHFGPLREGSTNLLGVEKGSNEFLELEELYHEALLEHRAMPSTPGHLWPEWNETEGILERGEAQRMRELVEEKHVNALDMPLRYEEDPPLCRAYLAATADWLRKLGYLDLAYVYLEDEPNDAGEYEIVRRQGALIASADPGIARLCTEQTIPTRTEWGNLYGAVDIWCPLWGLWNDSTAKERLEKDEELWSYTALCQGPAGTPWWEIDTDPLNFRSPFWLSWHYDITGYLYWSSTYWRAYETARGVWDAPYFREDFWGEGMLLYPGKPAGVWGFVPSIRLKLYREAMEDYEYMVMAAGLGKEEEVDRIVEGVVSTFQEWSRDKAEYKAARKKLAELILGNK